MSPFLTVRRKTMREAFICAGTRTAIGRYGGGLATIRPDDMAAHVIQAVLEKTPDSPPEAIDDVILGNANQAGEDNRNGARMAALLVGLPTTVPGATVKPAGGSSLGPMAF